MTTDVPKSLEAMQQTLTTMQTVGIALVLCFIIIMVVALSALVIMAFMRRSSAADGQINKQIAVNEKWSVNAENNTAVMREHLVTLQKVNENLTIINSNNTTVNTTMTGMKTEFLAKFDTLITQGRETLDLLKKNPGEHKEIKTLLEQLVSTSGGTTPSTAPAKKATSDMAKLTFTVEPVETSSIPASPTPALEPV